MIGCAASLCSRIIAGSATLIFALAALLYADAGETWGPYAAVVAGWIVLYSAFDRVLSRWAKTTRRASQLLPSLVLIVLAMTGAALAVLSAAMAARYALTPEVLRQLDRSVHSDLISAPGAAAAQIAFYSTNQPELPRLIFVHGTPGHSGVFADYLLNPVAGFETIAVDRPGFGRSAGSGPVTSFEEQARALSALLVRRQGRWPILIGHSLGGPIVARIAADFPDQVRGIVILAGSLDPDLESPSWYNLATTVPGVDLKMPDLYQTANAEVAAAPEQTRLLATVLERIRCPVEVIHGTADKLVPAANVDFIKKAFVNSPHIGTSLIEGEGHAIHRFRGKEVRDAIARLIRDASDAGQR